MSGKKERTTRHDLISIRHHRRWAISSWATVLGLMGFLLSSEPSTKLRLLELRIVPKEVTLRGKEATQRFLVLGRYGDGLERDITEQSTLRVVDAGVATAEESGRVLAISDGETEVRAEFGGKVARTGMRVKGSREERSFSFARDLEGILTRRGCNGSGCHGSVKGRGGFKLSLNGLHPGEDYRWIVEGGVYQVLSPEAAEPKYSRVDLEKPERSLLLLKPTGTAAHGGGTRFEVGSEDYGTMLEWVRQGAPYDERENPPRLEKLEVIPREVVVESGSKHRLVVSGWLAKGEREDLSERVRYVSSNPEVAEVSGEGLIRGKRPGETVVLVLAPGHFASARVGVIDSSITRYPEPEPRNLIDEHVFAKLRKFHIVASEPSSDAEFLRRVCLDLTGTLPPPERVREFLASHDPQKRDRLIEILLNSPEYIDYWTFRFADLFRVAFWAQASSHKGSSVYWEWIRNGVTQNRPYNEVAQERIAGQGFDGPSRNYYASSGLARPNNVMAEQMQVFLGRRLDCAQCHNHPYEAWTQDQYWGLAAFFDRLSSKKLAGRSVIFDDPAGQEEKMVHPRTKKEVEPAFLDGKILAQSERGDLRLRLANWMTSHPYFAETAVNRIWSYFFGMGIVDPVDDFRKSNPPSHPELLAALAEDFRKHGHDRKRLIRLIVQSRTYQLSSIPNESNRGDAINYSRAKARPLDAEVLLDAISQVTGVEEEFFHYLDKEIRLPPGTRSIHLIWPDHFPSRFLKVYGQPNRLTVPERKVDPSLKQALAMMAAPTYTDKISRTGGRIDRLLKNEASEQEIIEELFLSALSRFPSKEEVSRLRAEVRRQSSRRKALQDLVWAVITSREFASNH